ncbi:sugar phosphate isomerase/epimerase family protein [Acetonema longum]|nr:sugar phosphate isomerase/epimerase family protein [Acetonema longum]
MKLIISSVLWEKQLKEGLHQIKLLEKIPETRCAGIEFRPFWHNLDQEVAEIKPILASKKYACVYACNDGVLADTRENTIQAIAALMTSIHLADQLGAKILRLNVAVDSYSPEFIKATWWKAEMEKAIALAAKYQIILAVENGPNKEKGDARILHEMLSTMNSLWFRLTFDTANWIYAGYQPEEAFELLSSYIGYVHLKDLVADGTGYKHSYPGSGNVDVKGLAARLKLRGYNGLAALEFPGGEDPMRRIQDSLCYLGDR